MMTLLRMQLHHLRGHGYFPRAIFVNQEGLDVFMEECISITDVQQPQSEDIYYADIPLHLVPKLGSTFVIGV